MQVECARLQVAHIGRFNTASQFIYGVGHTDQKIMPKSKKPVARKAVDSPEQKDETLTRQVCALAMYLADSPKPNATTAQNRDDFYRLLKKSLHQKKDDILYDALDRIKHEGGAAYLFLKSVIEELAEVVVIQRPDTPAVEINAFVMPLFLHSTGGLKSAEAFQDQEAFEALTKSIQAAGLESPDATVVLVNHAYQLDDIDAITFSHLHEMVRDAHAAMLDMRSATATAIERSFGTVADEPFAPDDVAVELRFLLGFAMKTLDDPFYQIPTADAAMQTYFEARETRFQQWAEQAAPLVQRCFAPAERPLEAHFLYQDLFHGGKERGIAEYFTLQMMSDLNFSLAQHQLDPVHTRAVIAMAEVGEEKTVRANLYTISDATLVASAEKPLPLFADWDNELRDVADALTMIGVESISSATAFDDLDKPIGEQALV